MRLTSLFLTLALFLGGCRSWNVDAFGVPVHAAHVERAPAPRTLGHHNKLTLDGLTKDEKQGVYVTATVAVLAAVAFAIWG